MKTMWPFCTVCVLLAVAVGLEQWPVVALISPMALYMTIRQALQDDRMCQLKAQQIVLDSMMGRTKLASQPGVAVEPKPNYRSS